MREAGKDSLWSFSSTEITKTSENCDPVSLLNYEIFKNGGELNLEMDVEDIVELINPPDAEGTTDKLFKLKNQSTVIEKDFEPSGSGRGEITTVAKLIEGLNLIDSSGKYGFRGAKCINNGKKLEKLTLSHEELLREKEKIVDSNSMQDFFHILKDLNGAAGRTINYKLTTYGFIPNSSIHKRIFLLMQESMEAKFGAYYGPLHKIIFNKIEPSQNSS